MLLFDTVPCSNRFQSILFHSPSLLFNFFTFTGKGPLYGYVACTSPSMIGARMYWYTRPTPNSEPCPPATAQQCNTSYTHFPTDPAGILAGESTDPGHRSRVIGTDRAPMIGHIGALVAAAPTEAEASGKGVLQQEKETALGTAAAGSAPDPPDPTAAAAAAIQTTTEPKKTTEKEKAAEPTVAVPNDRVTFAFALGVTPTKMCALSNSSAQTGCMPATVSWTIP